MFPIHVMMYTVIWYGRVVHKIRRRARHLQDQRRIHIRSLNENPSDSPQSPEKHCFFGRYLDMYANWAIRQGTINQDIPFNRFVQYTFSYMLFLIFIILLIINHATRSDKEPFAIWSIYHTMVLLWTCSMFFSDLFTFARLRINAFSNFWRVYDLIFHTCLLLYLVATAALCVLGNSCFITTTQQLNKNEPQSNLTDNLAIDFSSKRHQTISTISHVMFALGKLNIAFINYFYSY